MSKKQADGQGQESNGNGKWKAVAALASALTTAAMVYATTMAGGDVSTPAQAATPQVQTQTCPPCEAPAQLAHQVEALTKEMRSLATAQGQTNERLARLEGQLQGVALGARRRTSAPAVEASP